MRWNWICFHLTTCELYNLDMSIERPWYRLGLLTWIIVLCLGVSIVELNLTCWERKSSPGLRHIENGLSKSSEFVNCECGWPILCGTIEKRYEWSSPVGRPPQLTEVNWLRVHIHYARLGFNIVINLILLLCTGIVTECYWRRAARWHQFDTVFVMKLGLFVTLVLAIVKYEGYPSDAKEWLNCAIIVFGFWCTFLVLWKASWKFIGLTVGTSTTSSK